MKPFDLQAALRGEPVQLCDGSKAVVFTDYRDTARKFGKEYNGDYPLRGVRIHNPNWEELSWTKSGRFSIDIKHRFDIVGMWEEPQATITIGDMEVPAPMTEEPNVGEEYWTIDLRFPCGDSRGVDENEWFNIKSEHQQLDAGLIFKTKEDAEKAHAAWRALMTKQFDKVKEQKK